MITISTWPQKTHSINLFSFLQLSTLTVHAEQHAAVVHHVGGIEGAVRGDGHGHPKVLRQHL